MGEVFLLIIFFVPFIFVPFNLFIFTILDQIIIINLINITMNFVIFPLISKKKKRGFKLKLIDFLIYYLGMFIIAGIMNFSYQLMPLFPRFSLSFLLLLSFLCLFLMEISFPKIFKYIKTQKLKKEKTYQRLVELVMEKKEIANVIPEDFPEEKEKEIKDDFWDTPTTSEEIWK